jgi:hypothetical protein
MVKLDEKSEGYQGSSTDLIVAAYKRHVDMTLIRENLRLSVDERFTNLMSLQRLAEELRSAGKRQQNDRLS